MIALILRKLLLRIYKISDYKPLFVTEYSIKYDYGVVLRNSYIVNNMAGNFVCMSFDDKTAEPKFKLITESTDGHSISGAKHFIHDGFVMDNKMFLLTECGDIFSIDMASYDCEFEQNIDLIPMTKEDDRSFAFYYDHSDDDYVISSNARLMYPEEIEYPINLERPKFPFPGIVASYLSKSAIDLVSGCNYQMIDYLVESVCQGAIFGTGTRGGQKIVFSNNFVPIKTNFSNILELNDNVYLGYIASGDREATDLTVILNEIKPQTDKDTPQDAELRMF